MYRGNILFSDKKIEKMCRAVSILISESTVLTYLFKLNIV